MNYLIDDNSSNCCIRVGYSELFVEKSAYTAYYYLLCKYYYLRRILKNTIILWTLNNLLIYVKLNNQCGLGRCTLLLVSCTDIDVTAHLCYCCNYSEWFILFRKQIMISKFEIQTKKNSFFEIKWPEKKKDAYKLWTKQRKQLLITSAVYICLNYSIQIYNILFRQLNYLITGKSRWCFMYFGKISISIVYVLHWITTNQ